MLIEHGVLNHWTQGSFEWHRQDAIRALKECRELCEVNFAWKLLATYPNHAIIVSERGEFYRCWMVEQKNTLRKVSEVEKLVGPKVYKQNEASTFYEKKAASTVSALVEGEVGSLVVDMMREDNSDLLAKSILEQLQMIIDRRNLWNRYYEQNEYRIQRTNWRKAPISESSNCNHIADRIRVLSCRASNLGNTVSEDIQKSLLETCEEIEYWLRTFVQLSEAKLNGAVSQGLVECLVKMDHLLTYLEGLRGRR